MLAAARRATSQKTSSKTPSPQTFMIQECSAAPWHAPSKCTSCGASSQLPLGDKTDPGEWCGAPASAAALQEVLHMFTTCSDSNLTIIPSSRGTCFLLKNSDGILGRFQQGRNKPLRKTAIVQKRLAFLRLGHQRLRGDFEDLSTNVFAPYKTTPTGRSRSSHKKWTAL